MRPPLVRYKGRAVLAYKGRHIAAGYSDMSVFDRIKSAIFGAQPASASAPPPRTGAPASAPAAGTRVASSSPLGGGAAPAAPVSTPVAQQVDIEAVMKDFEASSKQKLNWRTSIVDLLKLLDIDSSLDNRKALAKELGYTGDMNDSASMNVWLHKQVLRKLQESGGRIPASLID